MLQSTSVQVYFLILIFSGVVIALNAFICYMRTRRVPALKYFSRQQFGTSIAHLAQAIALLLILFSENVPQLAWLSVWLTLPAELLKVFVWVSLMLSLVGILNGIPYMPTPMGHAPQDAGHAAAFISQAASVAAALAIPDMPPMRVEVVNPEPLPVEVVDKLEPPADESKP